MGLLLILPLHNVFSAKHFKFMGVTMGGPKTEFAAKLKKKGLEAIPNPQTITDNSHQKLFFSGDFKGYSSVIFSVSGFRDNRENVDKVAVYFDVRNSWRSLYADYSKLKADFTKEFGQPKECREMFHVNGQPKTDDDLFTELKHGNCEYVSIFSTKRGIVVLMILYRDHQARAYATYIDQGSIEKTLEHISHKK